MRTAEHSWWFHNGQIGYRFTLDQIEEYLDDYARITRAASTR